MPSTDSGSTSGSSTDTGASTDSSSTGTDASTTDASTDIVEEEEDDGNVEINYGYWIRRERQSDRCGWNSYRAGSVAHVEDKFARAMRVWKASEDASAQEIVEACDEMW